MIIHFLASFFSEENTQERLYLLYLWIAASNVNNDKIYNLNFANNFESFFNIKKIKKYEK